VTPEEFDSLLRLLGPDPERAAERYEEFRRRLIRLFEWKGCERPEDLTDETFDRVARNAAREGFRLEKPDPYGYCCGVAYRVYQEYQRDRARERAPIEVEVLYPPAPAEPDRRLDCLQLCLDRLPPEQRELVLAFHAAEDRIRGRQQLAARLRCSPNALRIKVHRIRRDLLECVAGCLEKDR